MNSLDTRVRVPRRARRLAVAAVAGGLALGLAALATATASATTLPTSPQRASAPSLAEFSEPSGLAIAANHLWVTNLGGNSVTEINPSTRARLRTIHAARYDLHQPTAIVASGPDLFIVNAAESVTEIRASRGQLVRTIAAKKDGFKRPVAAVATGGDLFVLNGTGSITELKNSTGSLVRRIAGTAYKFDKPVAVTTSGRDLWVANEAGNTVTEISATTGRLVKVISRQLAGPAGIGYGAGHVWVADKTSDADTEISASTGKVITSVSSGYGFGSPSVTLVANGDVYVASPPGSSPMVTMFSARTGISPWYKCNTNGPYHFALPSAFAVVGHDLFVGNQSSSSLTEMNALTGLNPKNFS